MGAKSTHGASGRGDLLMFDPQVLKVITDPKHPRYDPRVERKPTEAMVKSIMRRGIIQPLVIYRDGPDVYVEAGRFRRACAIEANKRLVKDGSEPIRVPCVWRQVKGKDADATLFEIAVAENELREGTTMLERAQKMLRLREFGRDDDEIAVAFGCDKQTVKYTMALLDCDVRVQRAVEAGDIAPTNATKLAKLTREEQREALDEMVEKGATRGARAAKAIKAKQTGKPIDEFCKPLSPKKRERVRLALRNGATEKLSAGDLTVALVIAAALDYADGVGDALDEWPEVARVVAEAVAPKGKGKSDDSGDAG